MQRTVSVSSSGHKPPRPPSRIRASNMDTYLWDESRDIEKGEKEKWRIKAEQFIHLIPAVLLLCLLILYICSSVPFQGDFSTLLLSSSEIFLPVKILLGKEPQCLKSWHWIYVSLSTHTFSVEITERACTQANNYRASTLHGNFYNWSSNCSKIRNMHTVCVQKKLPLLCTAREVSCYPCLFHCPLVLLVEATVHVHDWLSPLILICISHCTGHDLLRDDATHLKISEKTVASERHLQQTRMLQVGINSTNSGTVEQPKVDYQRHQSNSEHLLRGTVKWEIVLN